MALWGVGWFPQERPSWAWLQGWGPGQAPRRSCGFSGLDLSLPGTEEAALVPGGLDCLEEFTLLFFKIIFTVIQYFSKALNILFTKGSLKGVIRKIDQMFTFIEMCVAFTLTLAIWDTNRQNTPDDE